MPDLNLMDDDAGEHASEMLDTAPATRSSGGGGGGSRMIILLFLVVLIVAGVVFVLNSRGIIHLWGKKQPTVMTYEEPVPQDAFNENAYQQPADSTAMDSTNGDVALLDTTPLDEQGGQPVEKPSGTKTGESKEMPVSGMKLDAMKGDFTVQVVAFREKMKADEVMENLEFAGYPAFVEMVPMKGGDWYTVRIGRYPSRTDAKEAVKSFAEQIRSNYVIDKVRVH